MLSIQEAETAIRETVSELEVVDVPLPMARGRVLRQSVVNPRAMPPFDRVMMDGVGLSINDWKAGIKRFQVVGMAAAGQPRACLSTVGTCLEVMTGAICPDGVSVIVPREQVKSVDDFVDVDPSFQWKEGQYIHRKGSDGAAGQCLLEAGTILDSRALAVAASCGAAQLRVSREPRIGIVSSGNELIEPGQPVAEHQIYRSNAYALAAIFEEKGYPSVEQMHLPDHLETITAALIDLLKRVDVLVLSGGVSMGRFDYMPQALEAAGVVKRFHRVAQRPGKPFWMGRGQTGQLVFGLPGNPVSTIVGARRYVTPAIDQMRGLTPGIQRQVRLSQPVQGNPSLGLFIPVRVDDWGEAEPVRPQNSGDFYGIMGSDGFVELGPQTGVFEVGSVAPFFPW